MTLHKVRLESDFIEPYDHWFDVGERKSMWTVFRRSRGCSRWQGFQRLADMNLRVPYYGTVCEMYDILLGRPPIVLYHDEYAHRGEEKELVILHPGTLDRHPQTFAALYIKPENNRPISYRYLRLGLWTCWLRYMSDDKWRSNCGDVQIDVYSQDPTACLSFPDEFVDLHSVPLLAIDFVKSWSGMWWAVDYNTSPGIKHTPVLDLITPQDIVVSIKEFYAKRSEDHEETTW